MILNESTYAYLRAIEIVKNRRGIMLKTAKGINNSSSQYASGVIDVILGDLEIKLKETQETTQ